MPKKNNVPRGAHQKRALCTSCGKNPRRAPDQRWCLDCSRVANRRYTAKQRSLLAQINERLEILMERK